MTNESAQSSFVYVTFIRTTPERLWSALTTAEFIKEYWFGIHAESEWKTGAQWELRFADGRIADTGEILRWTRRSDSYSNGATNSSPS